MNITIGHIRVKFFKRENGYWTGGYFAKNPEISSLYFSTDSKSWLYVAKFMVTNFLKAWKRNYK